MAGLSANGMRNNVDVFGADRVLPLACTIHGPLGRLSDGEYRR